MINGRNEKLGIPDYVEAGGAERLNTDKRSNSQLSSNPADPVERLLQNSANEIDAVISDLGHFRRRLTVEGERLQREINKYAELNVAAVSALKIFGDAMLELRKVSTPSLAPRAPARDEEMFDLADGRPLDVRTFAND